MYLARRVRLAVFSGRDPGGICGPDVSGEVSVSEEYPVDEPEPAAPHWVILPTMPWTRVVPDARHAAEAGSAAAVPAQRGASGRHGSVDDTDPGPPPRDREPDGDVG